MCRLFGFRSALPSRAHRSLLEAENAVARQSRAHPDGWGIGWVVDGDAYVVRSHKAAHLCQRFHRVATRLRSQTFVVHVRRATVGAVDHFNAHPFRYGRWLFAHNGTVCGFEQLRPWLLEGTLPNFRDLILGDTDSEHLFYFVLSALTRGGLDPRGRLPADAHGAAGLLRQALRAVDHRALELGLERPLLNVILTDGSLFLAHRAGMPLHLSSQKRTCPEAPTCPIEPKVCLESTRPTHVAVNHLLVASEPIATDHNLWEDVPDGATVVLDAGFHLGLLPPPPGWTAPEVPARFRRPAPP